MFCSKCKTEKERSAFARDPGRNRQVNYWCKVCKNKRQRELYDPVYFRQRHLEKSYGLTESEVDLMKKEQGNRCLICKEDVQLVIDHCHRTGIVRGLLCENCNRGLGMFKENVANLAVAANYLLKFKHSSGQ